jgi:hypothetical protein
MKRIVRSLSSATSLFVIVLASLIISTFFFAFPVYAAEGEFRLQVSPSPLVATLKPGQKTTLDLKVRNAGTEIEKLKIQPRSFTIKNDGQIAIDDTKSPEVAEWLQFSSKDFSVAPGQWFEQKLTINVPKDAGFSYSFALVISRQSLDPAGSTQGQELKGQVAVFTLLNIDRPGAVRKLQLESLKTDAGVYEYLPATFQMQIKNTGNTIVRPTGNVFVQRDSAKNDPLGTLEVNKAGGYILPGTVRTMTATWAEGFPLIKEKTDEPSPQKYTDWDWGKLSSFRFGHYTAQAVVVYNDGQRDIPLMAEVGFWVIPWKPLLVVVAVVALIGFGIWSLVRQLAGISKHRKRRIRLGK